MDYIRPNQTNNSSHKITSQYLSGQTVGLATPSSTSAKVFANGLVENYIYLYHVPGSNDDDLGKFVIIPTYPTSYTDTLSSSFSTESILARSAPIFSYSYSGPRTVNINLSLHRDMMQQLNLGVSNLAVEVGDDYVDTIIRNLQAICLPKYAYGSKMVNPPMIAVRFGNEFFVKGIVSGSITITGNLPLLANGKYAQMSVGFNVTEVDPYDAETVINQGQLRGLSHTLERNLYRS